MIAYTISVAIHSQLIDRVIVSTDDEEIAAVSKEWGADIPFLRPKDIAEDTSSIRDVMRHVISSLDDVKDDTAWVELYPTSPFRTPAFIDDMLKILFNGYSSVVTVKQIDFDPRFLFSLDEDNLRLTPLFSDSNQVPEHKKYYRHYGILYARWAQKPEKHYFQVLKDKCMMIDIDTPRDLLWAENIIQNNLFDFGLNFDNCDNSNPN